MRHLLLARATALYTPCRQAVKRSNCLTQNLLESESLPQLRNLLEKSFTIASFAGAEGGEGVEVNDGGAEGSSDEDGATVSASDEEGEGQDSGRVRGADGLPSGACASGLTEVDAWLTKETEKNSAGVGPESEALRSESVGGAAGHLDDPGLHMWETTSGDHAGGAEALGVLRGVQV